MKQKIDQLRSFCFIRTFLLRTSRLRKAKILEHPKNFLKAKIWARTNLFFPVWQIYVLDESIVIQIQLESSIVITHEHVHIG